MILYTIGVNLIAPFTITPSGPCRREPGTYFYGYEIKSSNYPDSYDPNEDCTWTIRTNSGKGIELQFLDFDTEADHDSLRIYDGDSSSYAQIGNQLSGSLLPGTVVSSGSELHLRWSSDSRIQRKGFKIKLGTYG